MSDYACSVCGRTDLPDFDSLEILEWGEGGELAHVLGERDPLMLEFVCPECAAGGETDDV